jgi:hypothetical protein
MRVRQPLIRAWTNPKLYRFPLHTFLLALPRFGLTVSRIRGSSCRHHPAGRGTLTEAGTCPFSEEWNPPYPSQSHTDICFSKSASSSLVRVNIAFLAQYGLENCQPSEQMLPSPVSPLITPRWTGLALTRSPQSRAAWNHDASIYSYHSRVADCGPSCAQFAPGQCRMAHTPW